MYVYKKIYYINRIALISAIETEIQERKRANENF